MKFSKLALLGDLRQYSMNELNAQLNTWKFKSSVQAEVVTAEWSTSSTRIVVLYTLDGKFIQILEERWKSLSSPDKVFRRVVK
jgi:hypothetical protein